jgi:predicted phage tail protein
MLTKIKVYGVLRKYVGQSEFEADINTPNEAFSFLYCNFKGLEKHMSEQIYCVKAGDKTISQDEIFLETTKEIKIIPIVHGNIFWAVAGLVVKWAAKKYITNTIINYVVTYVAISMIQKGINDMLAPQQPTQNQETRQDSLDPAALASNYSFTGLTNVTNSGVPVNLAYGEIVVGSIVVSNGLDTVQVRGTN